MALREVRELGTVLFLRTYYVCFSTYVQLSVRYWESEVPSYSISAFDIIFWSTEAGADLNVG